jgi:Flp pilus assembly secretin CpaC
VAKVHAGSVRLAFIIIVSLLGAFLLGAVGSVSEAEAGVSIVKFDGVSKVHRLRIPVDKSDTIRLEHPFAEVLVGDSEIADIIPLTNHLSDGKRILLGMARYQKNESLEPQGTETSDTFGSEGKPPTPPAP